MEINGIVIVDQEQLSELIKKAVQAAFKEFSMVNPNVQVEEYLTRNEAASLLKVSPNTLTKFVRQGKLKAGISGGKYLFKKSELMKFVFKNR
jgi:excisionase family DNA binding protein